MNALETTPNAGRSVLVTGATGFVGRNLIPALAARGFRVRALTRGPQPVPNASEVVSAPDIQSVDWASLLKGVDRVIHLAARAHRRAEVQQRERDLYFRINVDAMAALAAAARAASVKHFIFTSSIAVLGSNTTGRAPFSASDTPAPRTVYGQTKLAGEEILRKVAASTPGMMVDILRPPMIVGPEAPGNLQILAEALRRRLPLPLAAIRNRRMFLSIDSLISFLLVRLMSFEPGAHMFTLADPEALSTPQVVRLLGESIGVAPRLFPFPPKMLALMLRLIRRPDKADALTQSLEIDVGAAKATGWKPTADIRAALRQSFASSAASRQPETDRQAAKEAESVR